MIIGSVFVISEAIGRIIQPQSSDAQGMMLFALIGISVNGYAAWKMSGGKSLNEKVVSWHLIEDVLGWVAVLFASIILQFKQIAYLDPTLSLLITAYILWGVFGRLKDTLYVFLKGVPKEIDLIKIRQELQNIKNVDSLHHTHIWSLEGEHHVFTTHLKLHSIHSFDQVVNGKKEVKNILKQDHFAHYTIETEVDGKICEMNN